MAAAAAKRWFNILHNTATQAAEIKLRGYIGDSKEGDPYWGIEGGAGTFKEFEQELLALGNVQNLTLRIFSEGGDVMVGMGIHDLLQTHPANKVCIIDGLCASAATYAAMACDEIQMPANAWMMIHNAEGMAWGDAKEMERVLRMLESVTNTIADLYAARSGKSVEECRSLMDAETWMNGRQALEMGFADTVLGDVVISNRARQFPMNARAVPDEARAWFDIRRTTNRAPHMKPAAISPTSSSTTTAATAAAAAAPAANTTAPAAPVAPAAAPVPAPAVPAPATAPDVATLVTNAVTAAIAPLQQQLAAVQQEHAELRNRIGQGVTASHLGGGQPATNVAQANGSDSVVAQPPTTEVELRNALAKCKTLEEKRTLTNAFYGAKR